MLDPEILKILDSEWVQAKRDENCEDIWGFELKPGTPDDVKDAFSKLSEAQTAEVVYNDI